MHQLLDDLYDPTSSRYHRWLQPGQFAQEFGPTQGQVDAIQSWLRRSGLTDTHVSGFVVQVSGTASSVATALGTSFERYRTTSGHQGYRSQRAPLVPTTLAGGQIAAILGLDTVASFEPEQSPAPLARTDPESHVQAAASGPSACPAAQAEAGSSYYTLDTLGSAYGISSLLADGQTGHGQTLGLYELASHSASDVANYASCFGLSNPLSTISVDGGGGAGGGNGTVEANIDIEQVETQAPGASVISYEGPNSGGGAYDVWNQMVSSDTANVLSTSWGLCEPYARSGGEIAAFSTLFSQAAAQGQTVLAASGDSGSEDCTPENGSTQLEVDYPSSDASVTGVGGTDLFSTTDEVAWPDGGGGLSRYIARPSWQPTVFNWGGSGNACGISCREVPDISANAGVGMVVYSGGAWMPIGGTSMAAPLIAGLVADRNQGCTTATADLAPTLYSASSQGLYNTGLTDIISGNNDLAGTYGGAYFAATTGDDLATGLGTPLAGGLSCPEVTSVGSGTAGSQVTVTGLGLEHASVSFGTTPGTVVSATASSATVVVPAGNGTVTVRATSSLGGGTQTSSFSYGTPPPADPPGGATPVYPSFDNGTVSAIRDTGDETSLGLTQTLGDLYTAAGLYGCTLNTGNEPTLYNSGVTSSAADANEYCRKGANVATSDTADNWDRTEVESGVDGVGSALGQAQLCGTARSPLAVDFVRSTVPAGTACSGLGEVGFAKDSVPGLEFRLDPSTFGTVLPSSPYAAVNGGRLGDVAEGWLPGDPTHGPYSGTPLTNLADNDNGGGTSSTAYRLWCATGPTRITDWGQLTNLGPGLVVPAVTVTAGSKTATITGILSSSISAGQAVTDLTTSTDLAPGTTVSSSGGSLTLSAPAVASGTDTLSIAIGKTLPVGSGQPIGVAVRLVGVDPNSGTESTWASYAESGVTGGGCATSANANAAGDPNPATATGGNAGPHIALADNASQIGTFAAVDFPGDTSSQAIEIAASIEYESSAAYNSSPTAGGVILAGTTYSGATVTLNGSSPSAPNVLGNKFATSRTIFAVYRTSTLRASTAGFLNWLCDSQSAITKQKDRTTGANLDNEVTTTIQSFGFIRLTDKTAVASSGDTPADGVVGGGTDTACAAGLNSGSTAGSGQPSITTAPVSGS
jgi:hypothetical protein